MEREVTVNTDEKGWTEEIVQISDEPIVSDNPASNLGIMALEETLRAGDSIEIPAIKLRLFGVGNPKLGENNCE